MSADNYFVVMEHPNGGYAAVQGFESLEEVPKASTKDRKHDTPFEAYEWARQFHSEYGVSYSPSVRAKMRADYESRLKPAPKTS